MEKTVNPKLASSFGGTVEKKIPDNVEWIDDAFYIKETRFGLFTSCLLYTSPSPRDRQKSRMPSSA